jgi:predicted CXXCH cytochrome family protein
MGEIRFLIFNSSLFSALCVLCALCGESQQKPAAWGSDHVGQSVPEFVSGDECLFCHRSDIGPNWPRNHHSRTLREPEPGSPPLAELRKAHPGQASQVKYVLGAEQRLRFLKVSPEYGKLELLSTQWEAAHAGKPAHLIEASPPAWDKKKFGDSCAGCHATAVDVKTHAFSVATLDCFVCHGDVDVKHSKDPKLVYLAKKRQDSMRVVTSICAQCHLRGGKSRSSGLPYANNFVAGDNLFRDYQVDLSPEHLKGLNPGDRHVVENVRDVVLLGKEEVTCLSCHNVHKQTSKKHHLVEESDYCLSCHEATGSKKKLKSYEVHSRTCEY